MFYLISWYVWINSILLLGSGGSWEFWDIYGKVCGIINENSKIVLIVF